MKEIVKNLESKVSELEAKDVQMQNKVNELELNDVQMRDKVAQQDLLLSDLLREKNERTAAANHFESAPMRSNESAVAINGLPSSCDDLKMIGHTLNGIYSIAGSAMMESVFCDFSKLSSDPGKNFIFYFDLIIQRLNNYFISSKDFQKWIGYVDVKSVPVYFYVQRNSIFNTITTPIPFDLAVVNEGNAMNLTSGIFTAPRPGIYFFSFTGLANFPASSSEVYLGVGLYLNGGQIGRGLVEESNTVNTQTDQLTVQSTLSLKKDDQVWVAINVMSTDVYLYDSGNHFTHFTGFMLEEEIVTSL
jgi:hypothetical protein